MKQIQYVLHPLPIFRIEKRRDWSAEDAKVLFEDFMRLIPFRMTQLQRVVVQDSHSKAWAADFSRDSFAALMECMDRRLVPVSQVLADFSLDPDAPFDGYLTKRTIAPLFTPVLDSIVIDVAIYWMECLRYNRRGFRWVRVAKPKNAALLNSPALVGPIIGFEYTPWINITTWVVQRLRDRERIESAAGHLDELLADSAHMAVDKHGC